MSLRVIAMLALSLAAAGCAKRDPAVESLAGSEPQRLSFGPPTEVEASFVEKMKLCWFSGAGAVLRGYRYELGERPPSEGSDGETSANGYRNVKIYEEQGSAATFEVQFHKYNENTLIVTRNVALEGSTLEKVKRDIQLWALTGTDCN